jgi:ribonucleoside-diphosphate reductase alpha chain
MINIDKCNEALPKQQKDLGLKIRQSNLCSEITLPTDEERTAVCCLSSVNLEYFDDWSKDDNFILDLIHN